MKTIDGREVHNAVLNDLRDKNFSWLDRTKGTNVNELMTSGFDMVTKSSYICINLNALKFAGKYGRGELISFFKDYLKMLLFKKGCLGFIEIKFHISDNWFDPYGSYISTATISV